MLLFFLFATGGWKVTLVGAMCTKCAFMGSLHSFSVVMHSMKGRLLVIKPMMDTFGTLLSH